MCFYAKDCSSWDISNWCSCIHLSADYRKTQQSINPPRDNILILLQRLAWSEWRVRFIHEFTWVNEECERTQWLWHFQGRPSASTVCTQTASMITWRHQMGSGGRRVGGGGSVRSWRITSDHGFGGESPFPPQTVRHWMSLCFRRTLPW